MRITESQLRKIVREEMRRLTEGAGGDPAPGDTFQASTSFVTDQALVAPGGENYYQQVRWAPGDDVEVVAVTPSRSFSSTRVSLRAPDVDDFALPRARSGMPARLPTGDYASLKVTFQPLTPKSPVPNTRGPGQTYVSPKWDPGTAVFAMDIEEFMRKFSQS